MKQKILIISSGLFLIMTLASCVPLIDLYYEPSVVGGELSEGGCKMGKRYSSFSANGIKVDVSTGNIGLSKNVSIFISLKNVPGDKKVDFDIKEFQVFETETDKRIEIISYLKNVSEFQVYGSGTNKQTKSLSYSKSEWDGTGTVKQTKRTTTSKRRPDAVLYNNIYLRLTIPHPGPNSFYVVPPTLVIDGEALEFPNIYFNPKTWMGMAPLNC
ncbi:MAG: hypothetical protein R3302_09585 [Sulfurimonadaceae bacterium]|nr:hypothetical protein [Sulfurimonadaceae bacterium]